MVRSAERNRHHGRIAGFTMIEMMLVLALIGLIMGAVVIGLRKRTRNAQAQVGRLQVQQLSEIVFQHRLGNSGECPVISQWIEDKTLRSEPRDPGAPGGLRDRVKLRSCEGPEARGGRILNVFDRRATKGREANARFHDGSQTVRCSGGQLLSVKCPGQHDEGGADIISFGPDGQPGTEDDIESWKVR
jgi:prepilin-type N-terminal cleavage/methylation domain-containing protein